MFNAVCICQKLPIPNHKGTVHCIEKLVIICKTVFTAIIVLKEDTSKMFSDFISRLNFLGKQLGKGH